MEINKRCTNIKRNFKKLQNGRKDTKSYFLLIPFKSMRIKERWSEIVNKLLLGKFSHWKYLSLFWGKEVGSLHKAAKVMKVHSPSLFLKADVYVRVCKCRDRYRETDTHREIILIYNISNDYLLLVKLCIWC